MEYTIHLGEDTLKQLDEIVNGGGESGGGGSSDFSTAEVTVTGQGMAYTSSIQAFGGEELSTPVITPGLNNVILYKGAAFMTISSGFKLVSFSDAIEDMGSNNYRITGDCAIELAIDAN